MSAYECLISAEHAPARGYSPVRWWHGACRGAMLNQQPLSSLDASEQRSTAVADVELQSLLGSKLRLNSIDLQHTDMPAPGAEPCGLGLPQSPATRHEQAKRALTAHTSEGKNASSFDAASQVSESEDRRVPSSPTKRSHHQPDRAPSRPVRASLRRQKNSLNLQSYIKDLGVSSKSMKSSSSHQHKTSG